MKEVVNISQILSDYPHVKIKVGGYTDNTGNPDLNFAISADRAAAVKSALTGLGIDENRVESEGYGEEHAIASNDTEEGRTQNRRIAVSVRKK
jgi:K(+)-stimulated pyrophosphate-energized sodium pump